MRHIRPFLFICVEASLGLAALIIIAVGLARTFQNPTTTNTEFREVVNHTVPSICVCGSQGTLYSNRTRVPGTSFEIRALYYVGAGNGQQNLTFVTNSNVFSPSFDPQQLRDLNASVINIPDSQVTSQVLQTSVVTTRSAPCFVLSPQLAPTNSPGSGQGVVKVVMALSQIMQSEIGGRFGFPGQGLATNFGIEDVVLYANLDVNNLEKSSIKVFLPGAKVTDIRIQENQYVALNGSTTTQFVATSISTSRFWAVLANGNQDTEFPPGTSVTWSNSLIDWVNLNLGTAIPRMFASPTPETSSNFGVSFSFQSDIVTTLSVQSVVDPLLIAGSLITIIAVCVTIVHAILDWREKESESVTSNRQAVVAPINQSLKVTSGSKGL